MKQIFLSLTTVKDWRPKVAEIDDLGLEEMALFLTAIGLDERKLLYAALEQTQLRRVPCVHLRHDMERWEIDFLIEKYHSEIFNLHPSPESKQLIEDNPDLTGMIYIENLDTLPPLFFELVEKTAGVCLDISHYEDFGVLQSREGYDGFDQYLESHTIGWNHISAIRDELPHVLSAESGNLDEHNLHTLSDLRQMDYLLKHRALIADIVAIELNNSLAEQQKVKEYISKLLA